MSNAKVKKVKRVNTAEIKKKRRNRILIIIASVIAAVLITGIILGCVPNKSLSVFDGYSFVRVYKKGSSSNSVAISRIAEKTESNATEYESYQKLQKGLKKTKYSLLRALFEGNFVNSAKFVTEKVADEDDSSKMITQRKEIKGKNILSTAVPSGDTGYMLEFVYSRTDDDKPGKSIKVQGEKVYFDTARVVITYDQNIIEKFTIYAYDSQMLHGDSLEVEKYVINPIVIRAKTYQLYTAIEEILETYNMK